MVDWGEGLTQEEQLDEVEFVVDVMQKHFGEDIMRGEKWTLEGYAGLKGYPIPSYRAEGHYYYEVNFDFSEVEASQDTQDKALTVLEELGLSPNGDLPTSYDEDRSNPPPLYVAEGEDDHGRLFLIEQDNPQAEMLATFTTRHSDDPSMSEAHEANFDD